MIAKLLFRLTLPGAEAIQLSSKGQGSRDGEFCKTRWRELLGVMASQEAASEGRPRWFGGTVSTFAWQIPAMALHRACEDSEQISHLPVPSIRLSVHPSTHPSIHPSTHLPSYPTENYCIYDV